MKKKLIILILGLGILTSCNSKKPSDLFSDEEKQSQQENVVDPNKAPKISFNETTYDFGDVFSSTSVSHYFVFTNTGNSPLIIKKAEPSCGCTVPEYPKEPIPVGGKDSIKVSFDSEGFEGKQNKSVKLITNTVSGAEIIGFTANVLKPQSAIKL